MDDEPAEPTADQTPAELLAETFMAALAKMREEHAPQEHAARNAGTTEYLEHLEREIAPLMGKVLGPYIGMEALPEEWRERFREAAEPEHVYGFLLAIVEYAGALMAMIPALGKVLVQPYLNDAWAGAPSIPLSPPDLADGSMRGIIPADYAAANAAMSGIAGNDFAYLVETSGEPPGPVDMLKLWLRGDMTEDELVAAIRFSRINDRYIPYVLKLAQSQMSPADAIMTAIKEVQTLDEAQALFERGGGFPSDFDILYQAAGDSIGIQQVLTLWKFGLTTEAEVDLALGRSRINPMFYPLAKLTHFKPLSAFQVSAAVKAGTITSAQAKTWLVQDGVPEDQATALSNVHGSTGTTKAHSETETLITEAYDLNLLDNADAHTALTNLGYTDAVATLILDVADAKYAAKQQTKAVAAIRTNYVDRRISRNAASSDLDALHIPAAARDVWLTDWDLEIATHPKVLTAIQLATAGKDGYLTPEVVYARIQGEGYTADDAKVLMQLHSAKLPPGV